MSIYPWRTKNGKRWFFKILPRVFVKVLSQVFCLCVLPWKVDWKCFHLFGIFLWLCMGWCANMFALTQGLDICSLTWQGASSLRCNSEKTSSKDFWLCSPRCSYLSRYSLSRGVHIIFSFSYSIWFSTMLLGIRYFFTHRTSSHSSESLKVSQYGCQQKY